MSKDLKKEYSDMIFAEAPDLWDRISASLPEKKAGKGGNSAEIIDFEEAAGKRQKSEAGKAAAAGEAAEKDAGIAATAGAAAEKETGIVAAAAETDKKVSAAEVSDKTHQMDADIKEKSAKPAWRRTRFYRFATIAAACICAAIVIPVIVVSNTKSTYNAPSMRAAEYATADAAAANEAVQETDTMAGAATEAVSGIKKQGGETRAFSGASQSGASDLKESEVSVMVARQNVTDETEAAAESAEADDSEAAPGSAEPEGSSAAAGSDGSGEYETTEESAKAGGSETAMKSVGAEDSRAVSVPGNTEESEKAAEPSEAAGTKGSVSAPAASEASNGSLITVLAKIKSFRTAEGGEIILEAQALESSEFFAEGDLFSIQTDDSTPEFNPNNLSSGNHRFLLEQSTDKQGGIIYLLRDIPG